jgi:hypothetical protein
VGHIFWSTHEVRPQTRRQGHLGRDPQGRLRQPRVLSHAGQQGLPMSFVLAHSPGRRRRTRQKGAKGASTSPSSNTSQPTS